MSKSCRICDSVLSCTHYVALFSRESLASDLANRLSKVADVPVASEDGLSRFICIPCKNKLMYFRTTTKATYEKNKDPTLIASGSNSQVQVTNKRTSGPGASPQTKQCTPGAKRLTPEHPGRRPSSSYKADPEKKKASVRDSFLLLRLQYKVLLVHTQKRIGQRFMKFCHCFARNGLRKGLQAKR